MTKSQIVQYLTQKKISYAIDSTNQLPIYQRNITRQKLTNLSEGGKTSLEKEIKKRNKELRKIKLLVKEARKKLIISPYDLQIRKEIKYPEEVYLRLLYV